MNDIPVVIFGLKSPSCEEASDFDSYLQLCNYMKAIPSLFVPNALCVMSDMAKNRVGTITATEDHYVAWKSTDGDYSDTQTTDWKTMLEGMFRKEWLRYHSQLHLLQRLC